MIRFYYQRLTNFIYWLFATEKPKLVATTERGSQIFRTNCLAMRVKLWVYIPLGYKKEHPLNRTVYMYDGQNMFDIGTSAYGTWSLERHLDAASDSHTVVAGIQHGYHREADYSLAQNADTTISNVVQHILPHIEYQFTGLTMPHQRGLGGSSMGANGALAALNRSEFDKILAFSFAAEVDYPRHLAYIFHVQPPTSNHRAYLDIGTEEASCQDIDWVDDNGMVERCTEIAATLTTILGDANVRLFVDKKNPYHCESAWGERFVSALYWAWSVDSTASQNSLSRTLD